VGVIDVLNRTGLFMWSISEVAAQPWTTPCARFAQRAQRRLLDRPLMRAARAAGVPLLYTLYRALPAARDASMGAAK